MSLGKRVEVIDDAPWGRSLGCIDSGVLNDRNAPAFANAVGQVTQTLLDRFDQVQQPFSGVLPAAFETVGLDQPLASSAGLCCRAPCGLKCWCSS